MQAGPEFPTIHKTVRVCAAAWRRRASSCGFPPSCDSSTLALLWARFCSASGTVTHAGKPSCTICRDKHARDHAADWRATTERHRPIHGGGVPQVPALTPAECVVKALLYEILQYCRLTSPLIPLGTHFYCLFPQILPVIAGLSSSLMESNPNLAQVSISQ